MGCAGGSRGNLRGLRQRSSRLEGAERRRRGVARLFAEPGPLVASRNGACNECGSCARAIVARSNFSVAWVFAFVATCGRQRVRGFAAGLGWTDLPSPDTDANTKSAGELGALTARFAAQDQGARRRGESRNRLRPGDRQTRRRCKTATRQARNSALGELSREVAGARQRYR